MKRIILAACALAVAGTAQAGTVQYTLDGGETKVYARSLARGEYVELTLQGDGDSNLDRARGQPGCASSHSSGVGGDAVDLRQRLNKGERSLVGRANS